MPEDISYCTWEATVYIYNILTGKIFAKVNCGIVWALYSVLYIKHRIRFCKRRILFM